MGADGERALKADLGFTGQRLEGSVWSPCRVLQASLWSSFSFNSFLLGTNLLVRGRTAGIWGKAHSSQSHFEIRTSVYIHVSAFARTFRRT